MTGHYQSIDARLHNNFRTNAKNDDIIIAEHRLYWLKDVCDRVIYMKNGRIEQDISMQNFRDFTAEQTEAMGLRTLSPEKSKPVKQHFNSDGELISLKT